MDKQSVMYLKLAKFISKGWINPYESTLVVGGGQFDEAVLEALSFTDFTISSLVDTSDRGLRNFCKEDVQALSFKDGSFDNVIVHAGLHHCSSPHKGLTEMYRVARRNVVVFEAQDSLTMRILAGLGLTKKYETQFAGLHGGGVENSEIPNYIYRWTKREVEKLIRSFDPEREPYIHFETGFHPHAGHLGGYMKTHILVRVLGTRISRFLLENMARAANLLVGSQGNTFVVLIRKDMAKPHPWITEARTT